jgi:hypothetical protein
MAKIYAAVDKQNDGSRLVINTRLVLTESSCYASQDAPAAMLAQVGRPGRASAALAVG